MDTVRSRHRLEGRQPLGGGLAQTLIPADLRRLACRIAIVNPPDRSPRCAAYVTPYVSAGELLLESSNFPALFSRNELPSRM